MERQRNAWKDSKRPAQNFLSSEVIPVELNRQEASFDPFPWLLHSLYETEIQNLTRNDVYVGRI